MKFIFAVFFLGAALGSIANATEASQATWRCECAPAVPFEGFQIYAIETLNGKESWMLLDSRATQYDDLKTCSAAILEEKVCQDFLTYETN